MMLPSRCRYAARLCRPSVCLKLRVAGKSVCCSAFGYFEKFRSQVFLSEQTADDFTAIRRFLLRDCRGTIVRVYYRDAYDIVGEYAKTLCLSRRLAPVRTALLHEDKVMVF